MHKSWTGKLEYIEGDQKADECDTSVIRLKAPSRFIATTIKDRYMSQVRDAFGEVGIFNTRLEVEYPPRHIMREQYIH